MNILPIYNYLITRLNSKFTNNAHDEFNPIKYRKKIEKNILNPSNPTISAVIIVLFNKNQETYSILIKRSTYNGLHSGQIALPGGKFEKFDQNIKNTAIRELNEELGIHISENQIIGYLNSLYIPISNFEVFPYVAFIEEPKITLNSYEVENFIIYPISDLLKPESITDIELKLNDEVIKAPAFNIKNHEVWGATSMILNDFKYRILEAVNNKDLIY